MSTCTPENSPVESAASCQATAAVGSSIQPGSPPSAWSRIPAGTASVLTALTQVSRAEVGRLLGTETNSSDMPRAWANATRFFGVGWFHTHMPRAHADCAAPATGAPVRAAGWAAAAAPAAVRLSTAAASRTPSTAGPSTRRRGANGRGTTSSSDARPDHLS
jgi:hypothetical protein